MKKQIFLIILVLFLFDNFPVLANIKLPALVGDNMILQRDKDIHLWGWAGPNEKIKLLFMGQEKEVVAESEGQWSIVLSPLQAGGPYEMTFIGENTISLKNIYVGDVWLASGQSNMEFELSKSQGAKKNIATSYNDQIHLFTVKRKMSFTPETDVVSDGWKICSPGTVKDFSAVAYYFGKELYEKYRIPIGLISSNWGGSTAEAWISKDGLKEFPAFLENANELEKFDNDAYRTFKKTVRTWEHDFGKIDRGHSKGEKSWVDENLKTDDWATIYQPGNWAKIKNLKGYTGIVWLRKDINVPADFVDDYLELSFGTILWTDSLFFNGTFIATTTGFEDQRNYRVPRELVKTGRNVIALRIVGIPQNGGILGAPHEVYAKMGDDKVTLAGDWLFKTGPDISNYPFDERFSLFQPEIPDKPTSLYNGMVAPLIPFTIKGVIWYQGEANAKRIESAKEYHKLFSALIGDWRAKWQSDFPFLFVQLAGYQPDHPEPVDYVWAHLREQQYITLSVKNTGMAVAIDLGEENNIHPKNKEAVGKRLALVAGKIAYKDNVVFSGPTLNKMTIEGNKIRLSFGNMSSGFWIKDKYSYIRGFVIANNDKQFVWAKAYVDGENEIIVHSDKIENPKAVRYNWGNTPDGNLYNTSNLPAVPFRTDNW
jgi:sialate O-acetylesterase